MPNRAYIRDRTGIAVAHHGILHFGTVKPTERRGANLTFRKHVNIFRI